MHPRRIGIGALVCGVIGLLLQTQPASATFPGANGKIALVDDVTSEGPVHIYTIDPDGSNLVDLTPGIDGAFSPNWSPDGRRIVFVQYPNPTGIWMMNADGSGKRLVLAGTEGNPAFSPDGRFIVFSRLGAHMGLGMMNLKSGKFRQLTDDGVNDDAPDWSPDGSKIVFTRGSGSIWVVDADGTNQTQLTDSVWDSAPSWSPDGTQIAFTRSGGYPHYSDVWVMKADGSGLRNVTAGLSDGTGFSGAVWSPDGTKFALQRSPDCYGGGLITINVDGTSETGLYCNYDAVQFSWQSG